MTTMNWKLPSGVSATMRLAIIVFWLAAPTTIAAQEQASEETDEPTVAEKLSAIEGELDQHKTQIKAQQNQLEAQQRQLEGQQQQIDELTEFQEEEALAAVEDNALEDSRLLKLFGFFELQFMKTLVERDSFYHTSVPSNSSFVLSQINLYLASQMTQTLGALVELRFTFWPAGFESEHPFIAHLGNTELSGNEYVRINTEYYDYSENIINKTGGVMIERAQLIYTPLDWFNVIAGYYLTPYGIWNTDHGSPVIIPVLPPYLQRKRMIPLAQTGLQVYGRFYPRYDLFFDYAITVSNGRGPAQEVLDFDENKGVGLRLRLSYEGDRVAIAAGGYGYLGEYSDTHKHVEMWLNSDGSLDSSRRMRFVVDEWENYFEYATAADLLIELFGVRIQSEFIWHYVDYRIPAERSDPDKILSGAPATMPLFQASYLGLGYYVLLAWTLPVKELTGGMRITPYFMLEHTKMDDTLPSYNNDFYCGGVNFKPSPYVTIKTEFVYTVPESELWGGPLKLLNAQLVVSF